MPESLIYVQVGGRLQCLNKLTEDKKAELLAGVVERIHELTPDGATTEDEATGKVHHNGHRDDQDHAGRLQGLRDKHKPKTPKDPNPPTDPKSPKDQNRGKGGK